MTCLNILTTLFGLIGISLDIYGVWKLFSVEPIHIKKIDTAVFNTTLGDWSKEEKTAYLVNELNQQISEINNENKRRSIKASKYRKFIVWGFSFQFLSVIMALLFSVFK